MDFHTQHVKAFQDAANSYLEFVKNWNDEMARHRRSFAEDYRCGNLSLFYHLHVSMLPAVQNESARRDKSPFDSEFFTVAIFSPQAINADNLHLWDKQHVFIDLVETVKMKEGISIPSCVRLYDAQQNIAEPVNRVLLFSVSEKIFKMCPRWVDRKSMPLLGGSICECQLIPSEIQSRLEIVKGIPKDESKVIWNGLRRADLHRLAASFRIALDGDFVDTSFDELLNLRVQIIDVLFGPFEF